MKLHITQLHAWSPGIESKEQWCDWSARAITTSDLGKPPLKAVPAITRRRLTSWGRMALEVACACSGFIDESTPCVFASRHGDTRRTLKLLESIADGEPLSPTAFSLSVHNSSAGIFSIVQKTISTSLAVAAGKETLAQALLEAYGLLSQGHKKVLLVQADEPIADFYQPDEDEIEMPHAFAMVIEPTGGTELVLDYLPRQSSDKTPEHSLSYHFLKFWFSGLNGHNQSKKQSMSYAGNRLCWHFEVGF